MRGYSGTRTSRVPQLLMMRLGKERDEHAAEYDGNYGDDKNPYEARHP
jgi:hypothetical protein